MDYNRPMVTYPWMVELMDGDHLAALILGQMVYWYMKQGQKPFYKAITPAGATKEGDSWCEEELCTFHQFERCRAMFSIKVNHPLSLVTSKTDADGNLLPITHIVQSYNDPDQRRVYWSVNLPLLYWYKEQICGGEITLESLENARVEFPTPAKTLSGSGIYPYPVPTKNLTPITKNTTKNTTDIVVRDGLAVAIAEVHLGLRADEMWPVHVAAKIDQYQAILERVGIEAREVYGFRDWYEKEVGVTNLPTKFDKFETHYRKYKAHLDEARESVNREEREQAEREARRRTLTIS